MDRRTFGKMLFASGAAAALPLPSVGASVGAVAGQTVSRAKYVWAVAMAHARGTVSPEIIQTGLGVTPQAAQALYGRLLDRGVITQVAGLGQAVQPVFHANRQIALASQAAAQAAAPQKSASGGLEKLARKTLTETEGTADIAAPQEPPAEPVPEASQDTPPDSPDEDRPEPVQPLD